MRSSGGRVEQPTTGNSGVKHTVSSTQTDDSGMLLNKDNFLLERSEMTEKQNVGRNVDEEPGFISPRRLSFVPVNHDSLRLTFSPTICEYEAEPHAEDQLHTHSGMSQVEDLKLQVSCLTSLWRCLLTSNFVI